MGEQEYTEQAIIKEAKQNTEYLQQMNNTASLDRLVTTAEKYQQGYRKEVWSSGFYDLDYELDGGFYGSQLTIIGAVSSLGKSSYCLQIANQMAEQGKDVLYFSLEMGRDELNAKTVSRYSHILTEEAIQDYAFLDGIKTKFTTNEILKGDVNLDDSVSKEYYENAIAKAKGIAAYTYIYVGNNDVNIDRITDVVKRHIAATGRRPVVFLDYLQIMSPSSASEKNRYDARRSTNDDVTKLKVLAREFDIPVIVISAFNRASYTDPVSMSSFRESSAIEYSADVLIGLQYKGMEYYTENHASKEKETEAKHHARVLELFEKMQSLAREGKSQHIELKLLKNRNGSRTTVEFDFTPKYNFFEPHGEPSPYKESDFKNPLASRQNKKRSAGINF